MERKKAIKKTGLDLRPDNDDVMAEKLLPAIARQQAARTFPTRAGFSFFYELDGGWETRILTEDAEVCKVHTSRELEDAFVDANVKIIFIPRTSAVTRTVALRVCRRHGAGKTVFYEGKSDE